MNDNFRQWRNLAKWRRHFVTANKYQKDPFGIHVLVPVRYQSATIKDMSNRECMRKALARVRQGRSVFFVGQPGSGKTHAALALMRFAAIRFVFVREGDILKWQRTSNIAAYTTTGQMSFELQSSYADSQDGQSAFRLMAQLSSVPLLVVDDVSMVTPSPNFANFLRQLIDRRYSNMKQTFITSNIGYQGLSAIYGDPMISRLAQMCGSQIDFGSDDRRTDKKYAD